jgi:DNA repair exonuclease SbcCD ATPase subunit
VDRKNKILKRRPTARTGYGWHKASREPANRLKEEPASAPAPPEEAGTDSEILRLKEELARAREGFQAMIQELETTLKTTEEELRSTSEEAMSSIEELRCANEELESAKEELQHRNEELITLNELEQKRNLKLAELSDDLTNILSSVNIPLVILGSGGKIRHHAQRREIIPCTALGRGPAHQRYPHGPRDYGLR